MDLVQSHDLHCLHHHIGWHNSMLELGVGNIASKLYHDVSRKFAIMIFMIQKQILANAFSECRLHAAVLISANKTVAVFLLLVSYFKYQ